MLTSSEICNKSLTNLDVSCFLKSDFEEGLITTKAPVLYFTVLEYNAMHFSLLYFALIHFTIKSLYLTELCSAGVEDWGGGFIGALLGTVDKNKS